MSSLEDIIVGIASMQMLNIVYQQFFCALSTYIQA